MAKRQLISAAGGIGLHLARGECPRIIDVEGGQTGDLMAFSADGRERLSNGRSFDYNGKIYLSTGDVLWSDRSSPMLTIMEDDVGRHDFLYSSCSLEMYGIQYGVTGYHANCHDNLLAGLKELGIEPDSLPTAFNFFMNVNVLGNGRLEIAMPRCRAGDSMVVRAEMNLVVARLRAPLRLATGAPRERWRVRSPRWFPVTCRRHPPASTLLRRQYRCRRIGLDLFNLDRRRPVPSNALCARFHTANRPIMCGGSPWISVKPPLTLRVSK